MANWAGLRQRARQQHLRLRELCRSHGHPLIPADALLKAAEIETGFGIQGLPAGDPLLSGAQAFLDRDSEMIWFASGGDLTPERQRFAQAHEFAHYWLHPDVDADPALPEDSPQTYMAALLADSNQVEEGYSPQERREREANLFAAELLLPAPFLRQAFVERGMRADAIAAFTGLSETCVLTQLSSAMLLPPAPADDDMSRAGAGDTSAGSVDLDASQEEAAHIPTGPALVDAGPGTGKTRTLTARLVHLLRDRGVPPESILALTFSNRAANEMAERLRRSVGETASRVWIGTFHAFGFELLRKEGHRIGLPSRPILLEPGDAITLLERHYDQLHLSEYEFLHNPILPFPDILDCISRAKDELQSPEGYRRAAEQLADVARTEEEQTAARKAGEVARVYAVYQDLLRAGGMVDFGDLISRSVELLESCPDVCDRWQRQYPQILADEYQDINRATARLLQLLAGDGSGFWAVGDLRQAIYRFRGASPANIRRFEADFPGGRRMALRHNYRSRPGLIRLFSAFASGMGADTGSQAYWNSSRPDGERPAVFAATAQDENAQADWLAQQIRNRRQQGVGWRHQAILVATNRQASDLAQMLAARGIPVQHIGPLFDRPEVKDLISFLSLASEPEGVGLTRVARFPEIAIPAEDVRAIMSGAREAGKRFPGALAWVLETVDVSWKSPRSPNSGGASGPQTSGSGTGIFGLQGERSSLGLSEAGRKGLKRLCETLLPIAYRGDAWLLLSRYLFETSDYLSGLLEEDSVENLQKRAAIHQLLLTIQEITDRLPLEQRENPRSAFLNRLRRILQLRQARSIRVPDAADTIDGVRIMTIHQSKGLEFPVVYLPNLVKGQFPARGRGKMASLPELLLEGEGGDDLQAEDLFFVALSRAQNELLLSRTATWNGRPVAPSPLLERILETLSAEGVPWATVFAEAPAVGQGSTLASNADNSDSTEPANREPVPSGQPDAGGNRPEVSLSAIRQYQTCPRQYYYSRVLGLPERGEESSYRTFHRHLRDTLDWLQKERTADRHPSAADLQAEFNGRWPLGQPEEETALTHVLRERAAALLQQAHGRFSTKEYPGPGRELTANLENGAIRMRGDEVVTTEGGVRVTQHLHRRHKKDDHTSEPLALLRLAARQEQPERPVSIAQFSTATGESRDIKEDPRWEPKRVEKYEAALRSLSEGRFPPAPSETECASCPFFFICPA